MVQARQSWLRIGVCWLAERLLRPLRKRQGSLQALQQQQLDEVLSSITTEGEAGLAVLEGGLALVEADGAICQEEWVLFERGMARLQSSEPRPLQLSLHGSIDLPWVCSVLQTINSPAERAGIAQFYGLLVAADGQNGGAELAVLRPLLRALDAADIEGELPAIAARYRLEPGWLERCCTPLGQALSRWAGSARSRR
jgi:hypothetical protein